LTSALRPSDWCDTDPLTLARHLVGSCLYVAGVGGRIVETEAYQDADPASHSYAGRTVRNATMFGPPGRVYVYRSYGIHWCLNIVSGEQGGAALIRAIEPLEGVATMQARRGLTDPRRLCAGPGRLCQALGITGHHDGASLDDPPFVLVPDPAPAANVVASIRIGITRAVDEPWRFTLAGSRFLSRPVPKT
jgi:DNA-3-methyladenine glycosylase